MTVIVILNLIIFNAEVNLSDLTGLNNGQNPFSQ